MAKISLRMYNREIEGLIEQGQRLDEAIAHCRHILTTYPKHLETYRLLGKAYLEARHYDESVDIFQRVLVVAPDDFVSHVGMSIIADDKGRLDDAIWHMERAFEVQPANAAIQAELQRLFGRRDGIEPPKIRLTRGALAHMYVQGELFPQAVSEIRAVLSNDAKRTDMETLLARAYYRNGQKAEAAEICTELLSKYPYCLDANRLMAEIAPGTQRADMAQEYRKRVIELDPYAAFVQDSLFRTDNVADNLITIERFEYTGVTAEMPPQLGIGLGPEAAPTIRTPAAVTAPGTAAPASLPSWLQGTADEAAAAAPAASPASGQEDIPDFLRKAGWGAASEAPTEQPPATPAQPEPEEQAGGAVEGDLPDWVKALAPKEEPAATIEATTPPTAEEVPQPERPSSETFAADTPDWLRDLGPAPAAPTPSAAAPASSEAPTLPPDAPDWLRELGPASAESAAPAPEPVAASSEAPTLPPETTDWLHDLGPVPAAAAPGPSSPPDETPDWLKDLAGRELDEPAAPAKNESEADWLAGLQSQESAAPATPEPPAEESPAWLKEFDNDLETPLPKTTRLEPPPEPAAVVPPVVAPLASEPPASALGSLGTTAKEQDDAMAWLESLAAKHGAKPEELVTDPNARTDVPPEWVDKAKEIGEQEQTAEVPPLSDETGMWLRSLSLEEEKAEPAVPAEPAKVPEPDQPLAPEPAAEKPFDFGTGFEDQSIFTEPEAEKPVPPPPAADVPDTPDWLREFSAKAAPPPGMEDAPDWLRGLEQPESEPEKQKPVFRSEANVPTARLRPLPESEPTPPAAPAQPKESSSELPDWLAGFEKEEPAAAQPSDELPAWLQSEIEPEPEAKQPANPADWHPAEQQPAEAPPPVSEFQAEVPRAPERVVPTAPPEPQKPQEPSPAQVAAPVSEVTPQPVEQERVAAPAPQSAPTAAVLKAPAALPSLGEAQTELGRGNIAAAVDLYGKLIRKGKSLNDIIRDLRDALYRYPVEVPLWQSLGDAYMRANRLQEALDAYTKAEELLR